MAVLNGLIGDYLSRTQNGLATAMSLRQRGEPVPLERAAFAAAYPNAQPRVVVFVHGLMCTERSWEMADGQDYGSRLAQDLGFTPLYVRYNSGLAIAENGAQLSALLDALCRCYPAPIEELLLVGYSMGGLVIRSACHVAGIGIGIDNGTAPQGWLERVRRIIYIGTPHLGAPAERAGLRVADLLLSLRDPYARLFADLGNLRSAGMKDLGRAALRHEDRALRSARHPVPLLPNIAHHLIAGAMSADPRLALLFGDWLVPVASATFDERAVDELLPPKRVKVLPGLGHVALAHHPDVYAALRGICEEA